MAQRPQRIAPRVFFLNERQQLRAAEKKGFGAIPKLGQINWALKGNNINRSLTLTKKTIEASRDPLREKRLFVLAKPVANLPKYKESKGKKIPFTESVDFRSREFGQVFGRLGMNLVDVTSSGNAIVHASPERFEELLVGSKYLDQAGPREKSRWSAIDSFAAVPALERLDMHWLGSHSPNAAIDIVFEAQPLLTRTEADVVLRAVAGYRENSRERLTGSGSDYSGRQWARGMMLPGTLKKVAEDLSSLQSIHPPLYSKVASRIGSEMASGIAGPQPFPPPGGRLPTVAILDEGVPPGHSILAGFARAGQVSPRGATPGYRGDHGSQVASRIVYGEIQDVAHLPTPECRYLDVRVTDDNGYIDSKVVMEALTAVIATYPDVRVFNLSFNRDQPFQNLDNESKKEWFRVLRELENFAFDSDRAIIVAAGNTSESEIPSPAYPNHIGDGRWGMGFWSCGFNSLVCGSYVGHLSAGGLGDPEWPSPFTRLGPGVCKCPVPSYGAPGGNMDSNHRFGTGMGENVCDANGEWVETCGTSVSAPLLSREVAKTIEELAKRCPQGVRPFISTAKAFLALTVKEPRIPLHMHQLSQLAIGRGTASSIRLTQPIPDSAVFIWQGVISSPDEKLRIVVPIPKAWVETAVAPHFRLTVCWETPVNDANPEIWACRKVEAQLKPGLADGIEALRGTHSPHRTYPLIDRRFDLRKGLKGKSPDGDSWLLEVSYTELGMAEYYLGIAPDPIQRVGLAAELMDLSESPVGPQQYVQSLEIAPQLDRLSIAHAVTKVPISAK